MIQNHQLFEDINSLPPEGKAEVVDLVQRLKAKSKDQTKSVLDVLSQAPGQLMFQSAEDVDAHVSSERDEWDN